MKPAFYGAKSGYVTETHTKYGVFVQNFISLKLRVYVLVWVKVETI
jgi:hypothetical protein